jgi:adenylate cyclase
MSLGDRPFHFGDFTLLPGERQLTQAGRDVPLRPKVFDTLLCLVRRSGHAVRTDELLDEVWTDTHVSEAVLTHCITEARQALGDDARRPCFIKTVPRLGYKFVGIVTPEPLVAPGPHPRPAMGASVAVLPFANLSADAANDYFCDGLSEEIINGLTRLPGVRVVAHSSSFAFKGRNIDARQIGRVLNVQAILEGSVRQSGDRLRISAQLIDTVRGYHLWCEQYDRRLQDVFEIQSEIARAIAEKIEAPLAAAVDGPIVKVPTRNMAAYLLYLQGRACWHRRFRGMLQRAIGCFEGAIHEDPAFALAYTGLADCFASLGIWGFMPPQEAFGRAAGLARTALEIDETLAEAHASEAMVLLFGEWAWDRAARHLERALSLNPGAALVHMLEGHRLSIVGRMDEAIAAMREAQSLDPLSPIVSANIGWTYHLAHDQEAAIAELLAVLEVEPDNPLAAFYLGFAYAATGRFDEALDSFSRTARATGGMPWLAESVGLVHGLAGNREAAMAALADAHVRRAAGYVPSSALALVHLGLGDDDAALEWLTRGLEERDALMPWLAYLPACDRLHPQPGFQHLLAHLHA